MTKPTTPDPIGRADLRAYFEAGLKPPGQWGLGLEYERFGILDQDDSATPTSSDPNVRAIKWSPLPIDGPVSVDTVLQGLIDRFGWRPLSIEGRTLELSRGPSRVTLEPGGQMELSGAVHRSVGETAAELAGYLREVRNVSEPLGARWLGVGTHPTAAIEDIPFLRKKRYRIMKDYLPLKGKLALHMMKATCGAQVNLDFSDEADAMYKLRVAMGLSSVVSAMFANSGITAGKPNGYLTQRIAIWNETDPDRCGLLPFVFSPSASFDDYIDWALSVPMLFLVRGDRWIPLNGVTFGDFLERGHEGHAPTKADWALHLSTLFPDVRLKSYIEIRGTDSNTPDMILAHCALWKGILYGGADVLGAAFAPFAGLRWRDRLVLRHDVARLGLRAEAGGRPLLEIARDLIDLAAAGLAAAGAADDGLYLDPLRQMIRRGVTPAEDLLAVFRSAPGGNLGAVLDRAARIDPPA